MFAFASLLGHMQALGQRTALIECDDDAGHSYAYAMLATQARALAQGLVAAGIVPGDPVGLFAPNGADWIIARLGIAAVGGIAVAIDHQADAAEAGGIIVSSKLGMLLAGRAQQSVLEQIDPAVRPPIMLMTEDDEATSWRPLFAAGDHSPLPMPSDEAAAMLVYTSGTTGNPKAFLLRNRHIEANVRAIAGFGLIGPGDRLLMPLPLHHVYPFVVGLMVPFALGATVVLPQAASGAKIVDALLGSDATAMIGVPRLYEALIAGVEGQARARGRLPALLFRLTLGLAMAARRRFGIRLGRLLFRPVHARLGPRLRLLVSAGAKLEGEAIWTLEALGFIALSGYGLAETASAFTGNVPGAQRIGSEGRPLLADGRIRIDQPDADGIGEIELRGPSVFEGYIDNPEANREAFTVDGWFRTGDLGCVDTDGYLTVSGRRKEMIVLGGGKNVFPEEVEKRYGADPAIRELALLERQGALVALVLPDVAAIRASANSGIEDVIRVALAAVARDLPSHERLSGFALVRQPLPKTRLGKYQRHLLPGIFEEARRGHAPQTATSLSPEDRALLAEPRAAAGWKLLQARYATRGISLDADPQLDLGIDSLGWLSLGMELESALGITLAEQDFAEVNQIRDLLRLLAAGPLATAQQGDAGRAVHIAESAQRWLKPESWSQRIAGTALYWLNCLLARVFFRLRAVGLEHLPSSPPYVIVANHLSDLDPPLLAAALPLQRMRTVYWSGDRGRLFTTALSRKFCRIAHIFPVDERAPGATLAMAGQVLGRGHALVWFPESWRSSDGELQRFRSGIGHILAEHPVRVVPAYIRGSFEAMSRYRSWPRPFPVTITFAPAVDAATMLETGEGDTPFARIADGLRREVARIAAAGN